MTRRDRQAGVTLVEIMVVLAIIGIVTGASLIGLGAVDRGARIESEALRLRDRLQLAADEVLVTSTPMALIWDERGYSFVAWDRARAEWRDPARADLGAHHQLAAALRMQRADPGAGEPVMITPDLPQPPAVLRIASASDRWLVAFDGFAATAAPEVE